ncbi:unnamed protein product [Paramecium sonneborni]|uniref:Uncharacterized protein n=1 Tax=Paramecium sonneborni TaxID=65129 RepID=A0A8S1R456_9CILI|nr:unnamed protein product [Paramecium sonneborni]
MDFKEFKTNQYERKNRFNDKIKQEAFQLVSMSIATTIRDAIQITKEAKRRCLSGESLGKVFHGNSNKYKKNTFESRIVNKVQKRKNDKKYQQSQQM